jgi:hypothetical protein
MFDTYRKEARKCSKNRAYLAGCIFLGSALETSLLAMAKCYQTEVRHSNKYLSRRKKDRNIDKWDLFSLLELARELKWIPSKLPMGKVARASGISSEKALASGDLGYFADVVREIRNLVHPGVYLRNMGNARITRRYYGFCFEVIDLILERLEHELEVSIRKQLPV